MVLVKRRVGARLTVSKMMILEVFRKTNNNKMVAITRDKNKDKKAKWDNTSNKTSIIVESRDDSSLLLNKYESMNLEEEKR
jgi:hypothetical protein